MNSSDLNSDFPVLDFSAPRTLSPTDIGGFGRLEGCERFLRLRLHTTNHNAQWLEEAGLRRQTIPPLLTLSGGDFESEVEAALGLEANHESQAREDGSAESLASANERLLEAVRALNYGECVLKTQVTLGAEIDGWQMRGVIDLLRLSRDENGVLHVLVADMKASQRAKVEHRLQLAFYYRMIEALFAHAGEPLASLGFGVLYKGPGDRDGLTPQQVEQLEKHSAAAREVWGLNDWFFENCDDEQTYLNSLQRLVFDENSQAKTIAGKPFEDVEFHLTKKCDTCVFSEFCLKSAAQTKDLSLLPYLTSVEKGALQKGGIRDIPALAALKTPRETPADADDPRGWNELQTVAGHELTVAKLAGNRQVGARLDELIHRAHAFLRTDGFKSYMPSRGEGTLPYITPEVNANIVRIYLDAGLDYVNDRAYYLGARFVAYRAGLPVSERNLVQIAPCPPDRAEVERELIREFFGHAQGIAAEMANDAEYIDEDGVLTFEAPIHVTFFDRATQSIWLDALGRHFETVIACAPVFDFLKQVPSGNSFVVSTLDSEARQLKNFPLLSPSLQILARYLKFDWGETMTKFRRGLFDDGGKMDDGSDEERWFTARARFTSQIPLEYVYGVWKQLPAPSGRDDQFRGFRAVNEADLAEFCAQRLKAIAHIASKFKGNTKTTIRPYELDELLNFQAKETTLVDALQTFLQLECLTELSQWKAARHAPPERRMLGGDSLVVRYFDEDQTSEVRAHNAKNRAVLAQQKAWREHTPKGNFPKEFAGKELSFDFAARLRVDNSGCDCSIDDALALSTFSTGDWVWLHERQTVDGRLPTEQQIKFHPTVRQLLIFSKKATLASAPYLDNAGQAWVEVTPDKGMGGEYHSFTFGSRDCIFEDGETYSLDPSPNDPVGASCFKLHEEIEKGEPNFVYDLLSGKATTPTWPLAAQVGQARFLDGLQTLGASVFVFEASKESYIGAHGGAPLLRVQGPPGTGKTFATAFALLARIQGAMAAHIPWRGLISAHTHNAVDVALHDLQGAQQKLREVRDNQPELFAQFFDARLLDVPLFRLQGTKTDWADNPYLLPLWSDKKEAEAYNSQWTNPREALMGTDYCIAGAVPMGVRKVWKADKKQRDGRYFNALIVDEASQMNQPLACMAAVAHTGDSSLIVVGDPRQMPPITKHQWESESHRVFEGQAAFESLYAAVEARGPVTIKFEESFRLHARMAQFLREAIYAGDAINYHSNKTKVLPTRPHADDFSAAVLAPAHPIVLVIHDEAASILENASENNILRPILEQLTDADLYALDEKEGLGIVVPHRAQRALLADARWKVDTVERFQGDQRRVMAFSATESDPLYLLHNGGFLLDPRRLCVSLSRAKEKLILVAAKSVFDLVPLDEETFLNAQLWQKLRHEFCVHQLWQGNIGDAQVRVLGSGLGE